MHQRKDDAVELGGAAEWTSSKKKMRKRNRTGAYELLFFVGPTHLKEVDEGHFWAGWKQWINHFRTVCVCTCVCVCVCVCVCWCWVPLPFPLPSLSPRLFARLPSQKRPARTAIHFSLVLVMLLCRNTVVVTWVGNTVGHLIKTGIYEREMS